MSGKTHVSILQELMATQRLPAPTYQVSAGADSSGFFLCTVKAHTVTAEGRDKSKQEAKHGAARAALNLLGYKENSSRSDSAEPPNVNFVGMLQEFCVNGRDHPTYECRKPASCDMLTFTYVCKVGTTVCEATGPSKMAAKHNAAERMCRVLNVSKVRTSKMKDSNEETPERYTYDILKLNDCTEKKKREVLGLLKSHNGSLEDAFHCMLKILHHLDMHYDWGRMEGFNGYDIFTMVIQNLDPPLCLHSGSEGSATFKRLQAANETLKFIKNLYNIK